jgi:Flagellar hook-length control protein FliK
LPPPDAALTPPFSPMTALVKVTPVGALAMSDANEDTESRDADLALASSKLPGVVAFGSRNAPNARATGEGPSAQIFADLIADQGQALDAAAFAMSLGDETGFPQSAPVGPTGTVAGVAAAAAPAGSVPAQVIATLIAAAPQTAAGSERVEVILSPEELGHVRMDFRAEGDGMVVFVTAERQDTLDLLRRHGDQLVAELRQAGFSGTSLAFGHWGQSPRDAHHPTRDGAFPPPESRKPLIATLGLKPPEMAGQGLDLRI